jgi:hypothetical protein
MTNTRYYFRVATTAVSPTAGEKSAALPVGNFLGNSGTGFEDLSLSTSKGASQTNKGRNDANIDTHFDSYLARFSSDPIGAQTISTGTWTIAAQVSASGFTNGFLCPIIYVWRPGTSSVVGYIVDSHSNLFTPTGFGSGWPTSPTGLAVGFTGGTVTSQNGDIIVCELWSHSQAAFTGFKDRKVYFDGTTDVTDGYTGSVSASYLEAPQSIAIASTDLTPDPVDLTLSVLTPSLGQIYTLTPTPVDLTLIVVAPSILIGVIQLTPDPVDVTLSVLDGTIVENGTILTPDPVTLTLSALKPEVVRISPASEQEWIPLYDTTILASATVRSGSVASFVYPVWTITGPGYYLILRNTTTGKFFKLAYELLRGEIVTIDCTPTRRTVTSSTEGDVSSFVVTGSEFWPLVSGDNAITVELGQVLPEASIRLDRQPA